LEVNDVFNLEVKMSLGDLIMTDIEEDLVALYNVVDSDDPVKAEVAFVKLCGIIKKNNLSFMHIMRLATTTTTLEPVQQRTATIQVTGCHQCLFRKHTTYEIRRRGQSINSAIKYPLCTEADVPKTQVDETGWAGKGRVLPYIVREILGYGGSSSVSEPTNEIPEWCPHLNLS